MTFKTYADSGASYLMAPIGNPSGGGTAGGWEPSVIYMLLLIAAEILLVGWIGKHF